MWKFPDREEVFLRGTVILMYPVSLCLRRICLTQQKSQMGTELLTSVLIQIQANVRLPHDFSPHILEGYPPGGWIIFILHCIAKILRDYQVVQNYAYIELDFSFFDNRILKITLHRI